MNKRFFVGIFAVLVTVFTLVAQQDTINHWETVVFASDTFRYFPGNTPPPSDWMQPSFVDSSWAEGPGGFGYGDGDDATLLPEGILSVFLRKSFTVDDTSLILWAVLHIDYDDGFVAYLNGHEIARSNLGTAGVPAPYNLSADTWHEAVMYSGGTPEMFLFPTDTLRKYLVEGVNMLAIQVNNYGTTSSDLSCLPFFSVAVTDTLQHYRPPPDWFVPPVTVFSSSLPVILIDTYGQSIPDEPRIIAHMEVIDNQGMPNRLSDTSRTYNGRISIEQRGSSSRMFPKISYSLETQDSLGENNNISLLGLPVENDWILYAPYSDKSMMRNVIAYKMWGDMGYYSPRTRYCELFLNGDYKGVYVFMEKIKIDKNRVNIATLKPEDISGDQLTGGYLIKIDKTDEAGIEGWDSYPSPRYPNAKINFFQYSDPKYQELMPEQRAYIESFTQQMESVLASAGFADPVNGYVKYIEPRSFADFMIINELGKNVDGYRFSTYMYKNRDSKDGQMTMGPVWDFNLCFGNVDYGEEQCWDPAGWLYPLVVDDPGSRIFWWKRLMQDDNFRVIVYDHWRALRAGPLSNAHIQQAIDSLSGVIAIPQERNYQRWPILGTYIWPNRVVYSTWAEEVDALSSWIVQRLAWMDDQWLEADLYQHPGAVQVLVYPNPFTDRVGFYIGELHTDDLYIDIYNLNGSKVASLSGENLPEGEVMMQWDGRDYRGSALARGIYIYAVTWNGKMVQRGKIVKQ